ncbi:MAG: YqgE/AlgH family protein [Hyphomicrobiaceae bacterium]
MSKLPKLKPAGRREGSLEGQMLLAMPTMPDKRFKRAVIYMCRHSDDGALGIIVNQHAGGLTMKKLLRQLKLTSADVATEHKAELARRLVHIGGPVATERGFVLHTDDFIDKRSTLKVAHGICLTGTVDVLKAIAGGKGPEKFLLALGYAGWDPGQLEEEIQGNGWLHCPANEDLIFADDIDTTYERALGTIGVDPGYLVSHAGHA